MGGKEVEGGDTRNLFDTTASLALGEKFTVMGNFDYGKEGDVKWWGVAALREAAGEAQLGPGRALRVHRRHRGRLHALGTKAQTITVTSDHLIAGGLKRAARVPHGLRGRRRLPGRRRDVQGLPDDPDRRAGVQLRRQDLIEVTSMSDFAFLALTGAFFLVSWLYVRACEKV